MSPDCENDPQWAYYARHRKATRRSWDDGAVLASTAQPRAPSQYNPHLYSSDAQIEALEMRCYREGHDIAGRNARYLHVGHVVGACSGEETEYAFAECQSGFVHGRPISIQALRRMGVDV